MEYILASASPRRQELLKLITGEFKVVPSSADEVVPDSISAEFSPEFLAVKKAQAVSLLHPESLVIGADTGVFSQGILLGKPKDTQDAYSMLKDLSGKTHLVITGCALFYKGRSISFSEKTFVEFYDLKDIEIANYIATGSPFDKAGSYGIQDTGALFVKRIEGDYFNVVGLPISRLSREINNFLKLCGETNE